MGEQRELSPGFQASPHVTAPQAGPGACSTMCWAGPAHTLRWLGWRGRRKEMRLWGTVSLKQQGAPAVPYCRDQATAGLQPAGGSSQPGKGGHPPKSRRGHCSPCQTAPGGIECPCAAPRRLPGNLRQGQHSGARSTRPQRPPSEPCTLGVTLQLIWCPERLV